MFDVILVDVALLTMVAILAVAVISVRSLLSATMLMGIYSLLMAMIWQNMNAADVAFTEAAVGAGISTVLLLGTLMHTGRITKQRAMHINWSALGIVCLTGGFLIYGTLDMPRFGDPNAPIHTNRVVQQIAQRVGKVDDNGQHSLTESWPHNTLADQGGPFATVPEGKHPHPEDDFNGHSPNMVTSILASYRGYDTMFETAVIFTAGMALILLLRRREDGADELLHDAPHDKPQVMHKGGRPS
jgi:multicomponent Na+:H+ antiporter subunit B